MLGKLRLVKALGWDYSGKILAGPGKVGEGSVQESSPALPGGDLQGQPPPQALFFLPVAPMLMIVTSLQPRRFLFVPKTNTSSLATLGVISELANLVQTVE